MRYFIYILIILFYFTACSNPKEKVRNTEIVKIARQVSSPEIKKTISDLVAFETRWTYQKQLEVAHYLFERLNLHIANTYFHEYEFWGVNWKNVVGTIVGKIHPEQVVIVCAHLDSKSEKRLVYAPGANDNASGCAAVVELARILSVHTFDRSIRFIIFSREETDQQGSTAYVKSFAREKEEIIAALNLDMIAYGCDDEDIDLVTIPEFSWLAEEIENLAHIYNFDIRKVVDKHCY
jgi:acetylornithine deacetylase/succinyl-diaminopimelate desuccinylase-like protein